MAHDKRKKPRKRPDQLVYVDLGSDNGGILLNASEEGFSFQAVGPVLETGTIHFRFTISKGRRVEGDGELTWTDATKKVGGLRFTNISPELREQVRGWLAQSDAPMARGRANAPMAAAPVDALAKQRRAQLCAEGMLPLRPAETPKELQRELPKLSAMERPSTGSWSSATPKSAPPPRAPQLTQAPQAPVLPSM